MSARQGHCGERAIVLGASIAGLLAARVLSQHFGEVVILERDEVGDGPEVRKGQPHARHVHGLLTSGFEILNRYFPDLPERLTSDGALLRDMGTALRWFAAGGYRVNFHSQLMVVFSSRPLLECHIRHCVRSLPNVNIIDRCRVTGPLVSGDNGRITGVRVERPGMDEAAFAGDLLVDATGRRCLTRDWLAPMGYPSPVEEVVNVDVTYTSRIYRRRPGILAEQDSLIISPSPPHCNRMGTMFALEGNCWIVALAGWGGQRAAASEEGFLEFARSLSSDELARALPQLEPVGDFFTHHFPSNRRRHFDRLRRFPEGLLVLGDALCCVNPAYGQGMTTAAKQAAILDEELAASRTSGLWKRYFRRAAAIVDTPWQLTVSEDFRMATTRGKKPLATRLGLLSAYLDCVQRATHYDPVVYAAFLQVLNLASPPSSLFRPRVLWRSLRQGIRWPKLRFSPRAAPAPRVQANPQG